MREGVSWEIFGYFLALFCSQLSGDDEVALIRLTIELILDGVEARVLLRVMLPIVLECLVAGLKRLLREEA